MKDRKNAISIKTYLKNSDARKHYLYRAIDKCGDTIDWILNRYRNKKAAKRFYKKMLGNKHATKPRVINVDKNPTFPPALSELQATNEAPPDTKLRAVKYLNNARENDHKDQVKIQISAVVSIIFYC